MTFSTIARYICVTLILSWSLPLSARPQAKSEVAQQTVARCGKGWLERINGYPVLHLKGTHYEMGYQHGVLMREHVRENMTFMMDEMQRTNLISIGSISVNAHVATRVIVEMQREFIPSKYLDELRGLAAGAGIDLCDLEIGNFIPELMHCSGFALMKTATQNGQLLHGRVLDYAIDWRLQEHAVLIVAEPNEGISFVNVTYAGFIGSVTGMNSAHISIGEMGGRGEGHWSGTPMAFLIREVLETSNSLNDAVAIFRDRPRTCQYYYVIADGDDNSAVGMEASWDNFELIEPGAANRLLPNPVTDCVLMSADSRYEELVRRVTAGHGNFNADSALRLMDRPVAMDSNLHNVLFKPATTELWVANATADREPAAEQPYQKFTLINLLARQPATTSPLLPIGQESGSP